MLNNINKLIIDKVGRDLTEYISSNTMNMVNKKINPFIWTYDLKALIFDIKKENLEVITVTLLPNQHWKEAKAGQYIELKLLIEGKIYKRAYSISSIKDKFITITIKRIAHGIVSNWLHENLKVGSLLDISGPFGNFVYQGQKKLLFISAGTGITPCFSIIDNLLTTMVGNLPEIELFAQFSKKEVLIFSEQLAIWSKKIKLTIAISKENSEHKLNKENFKKLLPSFQEQSIYLCAPEGFMKMVLEVLEEEKYPFKNLHVEKFIEKKYLQNEKDILPTVYFKTYNKEIQVTKADKNKTLLELGLENGLNLEKGCKKGICGTCKLLLHEGEVEGNTLGKVVYLCTAFPSSELVVLGT